MAETGLHIVNVLSEWLPSSVFRWCVTGYPIGISPGHHRIRKPSESEKGLARLSVQPRGLHFVAYNTEGSIAAVQLDNFQGHSFPAC